VEIRWTCVLFDQMTLSWHTFTFDLCR